jgi:hypothetical protein
MKSAVLLPAIVLAAASLHAQYASPNQAANQGSAAGGVVQLGAGNNSTDQELAAKAQKLAADLAADLEHAANRCPISMQARQGGGLRVERAQDGRGPSSPFMTPSLTLHNPKGERILSASVTALGSGPNKGTTLQVRERKNNDNDASGEMLYVVPNSKSTTPPLLTRTLIVHFQPGDDNTVSGDLYLSGFTHLDSIALNSVTFADGSVQNFTSTKGCSVQPSPFMLVGATR